MAVASFPALKPSARSWTPGSVPSQSLVSQAGYETRVMLGTKPVGALLRLSFVNLTDAAAQSITDHFALARGAYEIFDLPAEVFAGMTSYGYMTPAGAKWRYTSTPTLDWSAPDVVGVSVSLMAVYD